MAENKPNANLEAAPSLQPPFTARSIPPNLHTDVPLTPLESLPTIAGSQNNISLANDDVAQFLNWDLDLSRLNRIHGYLWMAGRPMRARPLHRYKMMGYEILHTQQMDLHMLKFSNRIMLKPLAEYILDPAFWTKHICASKTLYESATGFLLSYIWLLTSSLDLKFAHDHFLLPGFVTWPWWKEFVREFVGHVDLNALDQVNIRFHFGDLRLGRINSIYRTRFAFTHFVRGYLYGYNRYVVFFQRKFGWILSVFVFFSLVLAAMQVGVSVDPLQKHQDYIRSCYGFVVFSMVTVLAVLGIVAAVFLFMFLFNMVAAIGHVKRMRTERKRKAKERGDGQKHV